MNSDLRRMVARADATALARDGTRLAYTLQNAGAGAPRVLLVHSLAMDRTFWRPVADLLAPTASVLTFDCRGHGASDKPAGPYTVELFARDLADLLDYVGWPAALVAGASMGGCISLAFAAGYPRRTTALGLVDTTAWYGEEAPQQWAERAGKAVGSGLAALVEFQATRWYGDRFRADNPEVVKHSVDVFLRNDVQAYAESCRMLGNCDLRASLVRIAVPTSIIVGEEDYATPIAMAQALHRGIANSTLTILSGARHLTPIEQPTPIAAELARLLQVQSVQ